MPSGNILPTNSPLPYYVEALFGNRFNKRRNGYKMGQLARVIPISKDTKHPSGLRFFLSSSPICRTISPLAGAGIDAHCGHALRASVTALLASCGVDSRIFAITLPVAGDIDSITCAERSISYKQICVTIYHQFVSLHYLPYFSQHFSVDYLSLSRCT